MRINVYILGVLIILFSFLEPDYFTSINFLHEIFIIIRIVSVFVAIIICIKIRQFLFITTIVTLYYVVYSYSTYITNGDFGLLFSHAILTIGFVMWLELLLRNKPHIALYSLNLIYSILVYSNIVYYLIFPDGYISYTDSNRYLLGVPNQFAATLIPAVIISVIYSMIRFKKIILSTWILIVAVLFSLAYFWSATAIVGISLIIIYLLLFHKGWIKYFVNNTTISFMIIFLFLTVVYFNNLNIFSFIIEDLLDKDLTLSTRTIIWEHAKLMINESPLFGYGAIEGNRYVYFNEWNQKDAHNMILHILLQTGVVGLSIIIFLVILMFKRLSIYKFNSISKFILFSFFVTSTIMLSEVYAFRFLLLVILLGIFTPSIIQVRNKGRIKLMVLERKIYKLNKRTV